MNQTSNGPSRDAPKFVLRLYEQLHEQIYYLAKDQRRSMNAEIICALENRVEVSVLQKEVEMKERALLDRISTLEECIRMFKSAEGPVEVNRAAEVARAIVVG